MHNLSGRFFFGQGSRCTETRRKRQGDVTANNVWTWATKNGVSNSCVKKPLFRYTQHACIIILVLCLNLCTSMHPGAVKLSTLNYGPIAYYTFEPIYRPSQPIHLNVHIQFDPGMVGKGVLVCCMTSLRKIINGQITTLIDFHFDTFGFLNDHAHAFCIIVESRVY